VAEDKPNVRISKQRKKGKDEAMAYADILVPSLKRCVAKGDKQDRQCTYNVTCRRVRANIVAVEKNEYCIS
jgi:hypothetical protein